MQIGFGFPVSGAWSGPGNIARSILDPLNWDPRIGAPRVEPAAATRRTEKPL
jgi:hypothetical protein